MENITMRNARKELKNRITKFGLENVGKFEQENTISTEILDRNEFNHLDKLVLMAIIQTPFHKSGKIEGIQSLDSSASNCSFCKCMRELAEKQDDIICKYCYDIAQEEYRTNVKLRHGLQLRILSAHVYESEYLAILPINTHYFRFNSSGDVENAVQVVNYYRIAKTHSNTEFALWSKNKPAIKLANKTEGKPENLNCIFSNPKIDGAVDSVPEGFDSVFSVYSTEEKVMEAVNSGAFSCNGKKCMECGFECYKTNVHHANIAELLRK